MALRFALAQPDAGERRVGEHAVRNQPVPRGALPAGEIVPDDPKVVVGYMRELRAAATFAHGPDVGRGRFQPLVDANVTTAVQLDPGVLEPDPGGVWNAPRRDQNVAAIDLSLAGGRAHGEADLFSGSAVHIEGLGRQ